MDSPGEILRLCRLCLVKDQVNIPIFDEQGDTRQIFLKISSCLPVKVSREDRLPKKICDGCSEKLNSFYEFWSSSANAEKTLLFWVGQEEEEEKKEPTIPKPIAALVKEESEVGEETHVESIEESTKDEAEAPPAKRARRSAAVKAQINITPESEDDDLDNAEPMTKLEDESAESDSEDKDPSYTDIPGTSADDEQAGPSGMGKDGVEAPNKPLGIPTAKPHKDDSHSNLVTKFYCNKCGVFFNTFAKLHHHMFAVKDVNHRFRCPCCKYIIGRNLVDVILHTKRFCSRDDFRHSEEQCAIDQPNETRYFCERCCKGVKQLSELIKHYAEHKDQQLQCYLCPKQATSMIELLIHYRAHTVVGNVRLPCKLCPLEFFASTPYKFHCYLVHSLLFNVPFECALCLEVIFDDEETFLSHVQGHSSTTPLANLPKKDVNKATCEICAEIFENPASCNEHKVTVHQWNPKDTRECPQCHVHVELLMIPGHLQNHLKEKAIQLPKNGEKTSGVTTARAPIKVDALQTAAVRKPVQRKQPQTTAVKVNKTKKPVQRKQPMRTAKVPVLLSHPTTPSPQITEVSTQTTTLQPTVAQKPSVAAAYYHQQTLASSFQPQLKCDQCSKTFLSVLAFNEHQKCHMLEEALIAARVTQYKTDTPRYVSTYSYQNSRNTEQQYRTPMSVTNYSATGAQESVSLNRGNDYSTSRGLDLDRSEGEYRADKYRSPERDNLVVSSEINLTQYSSDRAERDQVFHSLKGVTDHATYFPSAMSHEESYLDNVDRTRRQELENVLSYEAPSPRSRTYSKPVYYQDSDWYGKIESATTSRHVRSRSPEDKYDRRSSRFSYDRRRSRSNDRDSRRYRGDTSYRDKDRRYH